MDPDASEVWWSDWFSKADIFFYADIEGQGTFLAPQIRYNYSGGPILDTVIAQEAKPGSRVVVRVMDDDTSSNETWKSILSTRVDVSLTAGLKATRFAPLAADGSGKFQVRLLPSGTSVVVDAPEPLATMTFEVPANEDGIWVADGELLDSPGRKVGTIRFSSVWSARGEFEKPAGAHKKALSEKRKSSWTRAIWLAVGAALLFAIFKLKR